MEELESLRNNNQVCGQIIFCNESCDFVYKCLFCDHYFLQHLYFMDHLRSLHFSINNFDELNVPGIQDENPSENLNCDLADELFNTSNTEEMSESKSLINLNLIDSDSANVNTPNLFETFYVDDSSADLKLNCTQTSGKWLATINSEAKLDSETLSSCCDISFNSTYSLNQHKRKCHNEYECHKCNKVLSSSYLLISHLNNHYKTDNLVKRNMKVECKICFLKISKSNLAAHNKRHESESENNKCSYCEKKFINYTQRKLHERFHCHTNIVEAISDSKSFNNPNLINSETDINLFEIFNLDGTPTDFKFNCTEVSEDLLTKNESQTKLNTTATAISSCCDISFNSKYTLRQHKRKFHNEYECHKCHEILLSPKLLFDHLHRHYRRENIAKGTVKVECKICSLKCSKANIALHIRRHEGEAAKTIKCNYCNKKFVNHSERRFHERSHTDERNYQCEICGSEYKYAHQLTRHLHTHTEEKPYKCLTCSKAFKTSYKLKDHLLNHGKEKKFECNYCHQKFMKKKYLKQHSLIHSLVHKYECKICKKSFPQGAGLYSHMKSHNLVLT